MSTKNEILCDLNPIAACEKRQAHHAKQSSLSVLGYVLAFGLLVTGCNSGDNSSTQSAVSDATSPQAMPKQKEKPGMVGFGNDSDILTGFFYDSFVDGVEHKSCDENGKNCITGITNKSGAYHYKNGQFVQFNIGGLEIAYVKAEEILTVEKVAPNPLVATRIAQVLQSLDADRDPSNGIFISPSTREAAKVSFPTVAKISNYAAETVVSRISPSTPVVSTETANAHAAKGSVLDNLNRIGSDAAKAVLGMKFYPQTGTYNTEVLDNSVKARLKLHYFWTQQKAIKDTFDLAYGQVTSIDAERKAKLLMIEYIKSATDLAVAVGSLDSKDAVASGLDFATKAADFSNQNLKVFAEEGVAVPDEVVDGVKGVSGLMVGVLSGSPTAAVGGLKDLNKAIKADDDVGKKIVEVTGSAAGCLFALLPNSGAADKIACVSDQAELVAKGVADAYAALKLEGANDALSRINAVSEYLGAYYRAGGDADYIAQVLGIKDYAVEEILWQLFIKNGGSAVFDALGKKGHIKQMLNLVEELKTNVDSQTRAITKALGYKEDDGFSIKLKNTGDKPSTLINQGETLNLRADYTIPNGAINFKIDKIDWIVYGKSEASVVSSANAANIVANTPGLYTITAIISASDASGKKYFETARYQVAIKPVTYRYFLTFFNAEGYGTESAKEGESVYLEVSVDPLTTNVEVPLVFEGITNNDLTQNIPLYAAVTPANNKVKLTFAKTPGVQGTRVIRVSIPNTNAATSLQLYDAEEVKPPIEPTPPLPQVNSMTQASFGAAPTPVATTPPVQAKPSARKTVAQGAM